MTRNIFWNKFVAKSGIMYRIECWGGAEKKALPINDEEDLLSIDDSNRYDIDYNYIECPPTMFTIKTIADNEHEYRLGLPDNYTADIEVCFTHASSYLAHDELRELQKLVWKPKYFKNGWFATGEFITKDGERIPKGEPVIMDYPRIECGTCWNITEYDKINDNRRWKQRFLGVQTAGLEGEISGANRLTVVAEQLTLYAMKCLEVHSVFEMVALYGRRNAGRGEAELPVIKRPQYFFRYYEDVAIMASIVGQMIEGLDPNDKDFFDKENRTAYVRDGGFTFASLHFCLEVFSDWIRQMTHILTDGRVDLSMFRANIAGLFANELMPIQFYKQTYTRNYEKGEAIIRTGNAYDTGLWINISTEGAIDYGKNHTPIYQHHLQNHEHDLYKVGGYSNAYDFINGLLCSQLVFAWIDFAGKLCCSHFIRTDNRYLAEIEVDIIGGAVKNKIEVNTGYLVDYACSNIEGTDYDVEFKTTDTANKDKGTLAITNVFNNQFPNSDWHMEYYRAGDWKQKWHELRSDVADFMQPEESHTDRFGRDKSAPTIALHYRPFAETPGLLLFYKDKPPSFVTPQFFMVYPHSKNMKIEEWVDPKELKKTYLWTENGQTKARWLKSFQTLIKRVQDTGCLHNHILELLKEKFKPAKDNQIFMLELTFNTNDFYERLAHIEYTALWDFFNIKYNIGVQSESNPDCLLFDLLELGEGEETETAWQPHAITQDFDASTVTIKLMGIG